MIRGTPRLKTPLRIPNLSLNLKFCRSAERIVKTTGSLSWCRDSKSAVLLQHAIPLLSLSISFDRKLSTSPSRFAGKEGQGVRTRAFSVDRYLDACNRPRRQHYEARSEAPANIRCFFRWFFCERKRQRQRVFCVIFGISVPMPKRTPRGRLQFEHQEEAVNQDGEAPDAAVRETLTLSVTLLLRRTVLFAPSPLPVDQNPASDSSFADAVRTHRVVRISHRYTCRYLESSTDGARVTSFPCCRHLTSDEKSALLHSVRRTPLYPKASWCCG